MLSHKLTSTGAPGIQSGWNFSLCTIFHDGVTEYCIDKTCQVVRTNTSETKDRCPPELPARDDPAHRVKSNGKSN
jgi:hypothetical protein